MAGQAADRTLRVPGYFLLASAICVIVVPGLVDSLILAMRDAQRDDTFRLSIVHRHSHSWDNRYFSWATISSGPLGQLRMAWP